MRLARTAQPPPRLGVNCSSNLSTEDMETELFLHILQNCAEYVDAQNDAESTTKAAAAAYAMEGDGMSRQALAVGASWWESGDDEHSICGRVLGLPIADRGWLDQVGSW